MAALTEANLQDKIHFLYEKNTSTPGSTSADYLLRRGLMNDAVETYAGRAKTENIKWNELYTTATFTTDGNAYVACPSGFESISSFVKVGDKVYRFMRPDEVKQAVENGEVDYFYITGNEKDGYKINFSDTPAAGQSGSYSYYKQPSLFTATTSTTEMKRPYFIVYDVLSVLFEEERPDLATKYANKAKALMDQMIIENEDVPANNDNQIKNTLNQNKGFVWGK